MQLKQKTKISFMIAALVFGVFSFEAPIANAASLGSLVCTGTILNSLAGSALGALGSLTSTEVPVNNVQGNKFQTLIDCLQESLTNFNHDFTGDFVNSVLKNYTITDYLSYAKNLAYTVYVADQLKNHDPEAEFIVRQNIQSMIGGGGNVDLSTVYNRRAVLAADFQPAKLADGITGSAFDSLDDPFKTTPMGQKLSFEMEAQNVYSNAQGAANQNIANSQGKKDAFQCKANSLTGKTLCSVQYPAQYVTSQLDSAIQGLNTEKTQPQSSVKNLYNFLSDWLKGKVKVNNLYKDTQGAGEAAPQNTDAQFGD